ncbi:MAG: DUF927 domain-containing protein [Eubacteriales bacterium]|nr:DUF927 domain-containing protein [Eubacteriales bacterium]
MSKDIPEKHNSKTFKDELINKYNLIPHNPDLDSCNLNSELVDLLTINYSLRSLMQKYKKWSYTEIEAISKILKSNAWHWWEIKKVFEAYSPQIWEQLGENTKNKLKEISENTPDVLQDPFDTGLDLSPFRVDKNGVYGMKKADDEFVEYRITKTPIIITNICEGLDDDGEYKCKIKYKSMSRKIHTKYVEPSLLLSCDVKTLGDMGLVVIDEDTKKMKQYFKKLLDVDNLLPVEYTAKKNGWYQNNSVLVTGNYKHTADGMDEIAQLSEFLQTEYNVKGDKEKWKKVTEKVINQPLVRLKMYATVGAYIIRFTGINTFLVHNWYESSGAKTTSMRVAASLVGNPTYDGLIEDARSTGVGIEKHLEFNSDTPVYFDETSNNKDFKDYIYMMGNGKGKGRGTKDLGYSKGGTWHTIIQSTGEFSLTKDESTSTGMRVRTIEIHDKLPHYDEEYIKELNDCLNGNYGLFLEEIIQEVFKTKDKIKNLYGTLNRFFDKSGSVFSERAKTYFVVLAIGGYILEKIFRENGMTEMNPVDICKDYYRQIVLEDPTVPYSDRALQSMYQWTVRNLSKFERSRRDFGSDGLARGAIEVQGWITKDSIYYDETMIKNALENIGYNYERVKEDWKKEGIIEPHIRNGKVQTYRCQSTINGKSISGIKIKILTLKNKLGMDEKILEVPDDYHDEDDTMSLKEKCILFLKNNPLYNNATCTAEKAAIAFIQADDRIELMHGKDYIIDTMNICKHGCRST